MSLKINMKKPKKKATTAGGAVDHPKDAPALLAFGVTPEAIKEAMQIQGSGTGALKIPTIKLPASVVGPAGHPPPSPSSEYTQIVADLTHFIAKKATGTHSETVYVISKLKTLAEYPSTVTFETIHNLLMSYASKVLLGQAFDPHVAKNVKGWSSTPVDGPAGVPASIGHDAYGKPVFAKGTVIMTGDLPVPTGSPTASGKGGPAPVPKPPGPLPMLFMNPPKKVAPAPAPVDHFAEAPNPDAVSPDEAVKFIMNLMSPEDEEKLTKATKDAEELEDMGF